MTLERDRNGRIVRETCNGRVVESRLDAMGRRIERRIGAGQPGESLVRLTRDPLGLVARIAVDDHAPLTFRRDGLGREVERRSAAGFRLDQSWDAVGQLTGQQVGGRSGHGVGQGTGIGRHYAWDKAGAPTGIDDALWGATTYSYDRNGQVAEARFGEALTEGFYYDAAKNVVGVRVDGPGTGAGLGALFAARTTPGGVVQLTLAPSASASR